MVASHLKSTVRNMARFKGYTLLNIAGLAIGIASCLAVLLWVFDEITYDRFHENGDSIYRCYRKMIREGDAWFSEVTSAPVGPALAERTPGIIEYARVFGSHSRLSYEDKVVQEFGLAVDPDFLTMFSFPLASGDPQSALSAPASIVLTPKTATSLFGDQDPVGKALDNGLVVTGVTHDIPANSSIEFAFLVPIAYAEQTGMVDAGEWWNFCLDTYLLLGKDVDVAEMGRQIKDLFASVEPDSRIELYLQPLPDVHLKDIKGGGRIVYVYVFTFVAMLILTVACINFMNLATARSARRTVEIGIRKAMGASRKHLVFQILSESAIQTVAAVLLAVCLLEAVLPLLGDLLGKQLGLQFSGHIVLTLLGIAVLTTIVAGGYPALALSAFRPATVLKRMTSADGPRAMNRIRKALVVFQFTVSTGLIFAALVIYGQLQHIQSTDLGIDKDNIVCIRVNELGNDYDTFKRELLQYPGVVGVSAAFSPPAWCGWYVNGFDFEGKREDYDVRAGVAWVDHDFIDVFGLEIIEGRSFSARYASDESQAYIINEAAARAMNMESPVGKTLTLNDEPGTIVGVVKDFHFSSLHQSIGPLLIGIEKPFFEFLFVKLSPDDIQGGLGFIERKWNELRPGEAFRYNFFDDLLGREYRADVQVGRLVVGFTLITVLVACLGLFGLAAYSAERRTKEIGVRKVLGSSVAGIVRLLVSDFLVLVILGDIVAAVPAYYFSRQWLANFAYRISIGWEIFALAAGLAIIIALATVSFQAVRAARADPVNALKYE